MKSEPDVYSIDDMARDGQCQWEGVRNYQARNHLRAMQVGDWALFYHSNAKPPGVAGLVRLCRSAYPDPTQFDPQSKYHDPKSKPEAPRWSAVDVRHIETLPEFVSLAALKADPVLQDMIVCQRGSRLSVHPVDLAHMRRVLTLGDARTRL